MPNATVNTAKMLLNSCSYSLSSSSGFADIDPWKRYVRLHTPYRHCNCSMWYMKVYQTDRCIYLWNMVVGTCMSMQQSTEWRKAPHTVSGSNSPLLSDSLMPVSPSQTLIFLRIHQFSSFHKFTTLIIHNSFTPSSKPTSFTNPSQHRSCLFFRLTQRTLAAHHFLAYLVLFWFRVVD